MASSCCYRIYSFWRSGAIYTTRPNKSHCEGSNCLDFWIFVFFAKLQFLKRKATICFIATFIIAYKIDGHRTLTCFQAIRVKTNSVCSQVDGRTAGRFSSGSESKVLFLRSLVNRLQLVQQQVVQQHLYTYTDTKIKKHIDRCKGSRQFWLLVPSQDRKSVV